MRALITGISGFVGSHLAELLLGKGLEVYGTIRWRSRLDNISHIKDSLKLVEADMRDSHSVHRAIEESEPDIVFHLAAQSFVPMSWRAPADTMETNAVGTIHLLEAIRNCAFDPVIAIAGSSEEYGLVYPDELPIKEANPLRPLSPYGVSKCAEDLLGQQYCKSYRIKTVVTRSFNATGARRGDVFVTSNFAKQIVEIEKGLKEPVIYVGNLDAKRDFSDVRDIVNAYWLAVNKCDYGEVYNICSEKARTIQSVLDLLLSMTEKKIEIKYDETRMRPSDVMVLQGDCTKFKKQTGWKSKFSFDQTIRDLLDFWRVKI